MQEYVTKHLRAVRKSVINSRIMVIAILIVIGTIFIVFTHAAASTTILEAENGSLSGSAIKMIDGTASAGSVIKFKTQTVSSSGMGADCLSPRNLTVNRQQLWCETHSSHEMGWAGSYIFPWAPSVHGQRSSPYLTYFSPVNGGAHAPPDNGFDDSNQLGPTGGWDANGNYLGDSNVQSVHTWYEITSDSPNYVNAEVEIRKQSMNIAFHMKSSNKWLTKANNNEAISGSNTAFSYSSESWFSPVNPTGPDGGYLLGWNIGGGKFMNPYPNSDGSAGRLRHHGGEWDQSPITTNYRDVDAVVAWGQFRVVGPDAAIAQYRAELGVDNRLFSSPGNISGYPGRLRRVYPEWQTFTVSTMSDQLLDKPGYANALEGIIPNYTLN